MNNTGYVMCQNKADLIKQIKIKFDKCEEFRNVYDVSA